MLIFDKRFTRGICLDHWKCFCKSTVVSRVIANASSKKSSLYDTKCYRCGSGAQAHLLEEEKIELEAHNPNADICRKAVDHEVFFASGYYTEFYGSDSEDSRYRNLQFYESFHTFNAWSWQSTSSDEWWRFRFLGRNSRKSTESMDRTPTRHICAVHFFKRGTHTQRTWLKNCIVTFVRQSVIWSDHVSSMIVLSRAFLHEHLLFFTYVYTTHREHSAHPALLQALCRQAAPSRIWRKTAHDTSHRF